MKLWLLTVQVSFLSGSHQTVPLQVFEDEASGKKALSDLVTHLTSAAQCSLAQPTEKGMVVQSGRTLKAFLGNLGVSRIDGNLNEIETVGAILKPPPGSIVLPH